MLPLAIVLNNVPNTLRPDAADIPGEAITVPGLTQHPNPRTADEAAIRFNWMVPDHVPRPTMTLGQVAYWIDEGPLRTIQRICHITIPETRDFNWWNYDEIEPSEPDRALVRMFGWARQQPMEEPDGSITYEPQQPSLLVFVQAPWILSSRDLLQFYKCKEVRRY